MLLSWFWTVDVLASDCPCSDLSHSMVWFLHKPIYWASFWETMRYFQALSVAQRFARCLSSTPISTKWWRWRKIVSLQYPNSVAKSDSTSQTQSDCASLRLVRVQLSSQERIAAWHLLPNAARYSWRILIGCCTCPKNADVKCDIFLVSCTNSWNARRCNRRATDSKCAYWLQRLRLR